VCDFAQSGRESGRLGCRLHLYKVAVKVAVKVSWCNHKKELVANTIGYENLRKPEISDEIQEGKTTHENSRFN
jgi:hypothetical protein